MGKIELNKYLEKLENMVDIEHVLKVQSLQESAWDYRPIERIPLLVSVNNPIDDWTTFPYSEAFYDEEKMMINELASVYVSSIIKDDRMFTIRANYGVGIAASLFGLKFRLTGDNMPWVEHVDSVDMVKDILDRGIPDLNKGLGKKVLETEKYYLATLSKYKKLSQTIHVYLCDMQGPFDIAHLIWGPGIYYAVYDYPDLVHQLLELVTETYIEFTIKQKELIGEPIDSGYHSGFRLKGGVRICDDSVVNLSGEMYDKFCRPYNEMILRRFGGWIHHCGNGHHFFDSMIETPGVTGINLGNPEMYDLAKVYDKVSKRRICVLGWYGRFDQIHERNIKSGLSLQQNVSDLEKARYYIARV